MEEKCQRIQSVEPSDWPLLFTFQFILPCPLGRWKGLHRWWQVEKLAWKDRHPLYVKGGKKKKNPHYDYDDNKEIIWVITFIQARSPVWLEEPALTLPSPAGTCSRHKPLWAGAGPCWGFLACMQHECLLSQGTVLWGHRLVWRVCCPCPQHLGRQRHTHNVTIACQCRSWESLERRARCAPYDTNLRPEEEKGVVWNNASVTNDSRPPGPAALGEGLPSGAGAEPGCLCCCGGGPGHRGLLSGWKHPGWSYWQQQKSRGFGGRAGGPAKVSPCCFPCGDIVSSGGRKKGLILGIWKSIPSLPRKPHKGHGV